MDYRNAYKHKHICIVELICVKTEQISERTVGNVNLLLEIIVSIGRNKKIQSTIIENIYLNIYRNLGGYRNLYKL